MSEINWEALLGWGTEVMKDLRFVGYSYLKQGQYDAALKFFETLIVITEEEAYDLQTLGALYLQKGNNLSALNYLERALKLDPMHEPTLLNRAKALFLLRYKRQGLTQTIQLEKSSNSLIADQARALTLAYG